MDLHSKVRFFATTVFLLLATTASSWGQAWSDFEIQGTTAYFLKKSPSQILKYDLENEVWLDTVSLTEIPDSFSLDDSHIFIAYGRKLERIDHDGENKIVVDNFTADIDDTFSSGEYLCIMAATGSYYDQELHVYDKDTLSELTSSGSHNNLSGLSFSSVNSRIYGRRGSSPSDIHYFDFSNLALITSGETPYHGEYVIGTQTFVFPDGTKVTDSSGTVYSTSNMAYANSFGVSINALAFIGSDVPVVLSENQLISYSNTLVEAGRATVPENGLDLTILGEKAFSFHTSTTNTNGVAVEITPLTDLAAPEENQRIDPSGLVYTINNSIAVDGIVYLASQAHNSLFRWDVASQDYLESIPLPEGVNLLNYNQTLNRLYLYSPSRKLYALDLGEPTLAARQFLTTPLTCNHMISMGEDLLILVNGSWENQWIYDENGDLLLTPVRCCYDDFHYYDETTGILHVENYGMPYLGDGVFGDTITGTYRNSSSQRFALSPDGQRYAESSGNIYANSNGDLIDTISNNIFKGVWSDSNLLYSLKQPERVGSSYNSPYEDFTTMQAWDENFILAADTIVPGSPTDLHSLGETFVVVTDYEGIPFFSLFDKDLEGISPPVLSPALEVTSAIANATGIELNWHPVVGASGYRIERRSGEEEEWTSLGEIDAFLPEFQDSGLNIDSIYDYRIISLSGDIESAPSETIQINFQAPAPVENFRASAITQDSITVEWDSAPLASSYQLQYRYVGSSYWYSNTLAADELSFTWTNLGSDTEYEFQVQANNILGSSQYTSLQVRTEASPPTVPTFYEPSVTAIQVSLNWWVTESHSAYIVERREPNGTWEEIYNGSNTNCYDQAVTPLTVYEYRVKSRNSLGDSAYSPSRVVSVPSLSIPTLTISAKSSKGVSLTWNYLSATEYILEVKKPDEEEWEEVYRGPYRASTVSDLLAETEYVFRAKAIYGAFESNYSSELSATTLPIPELILALSNVSWNSVSFSLTFSENVGVSSSTTEFFLERSSVSATGPWEPVEDLNVDTISSSEAILRDYSPDFAHNYFYRAKTTLSQGSSEFSSVLEVTTEERPIPHAFGFSVIPAEGTAFLLEWDDYSDLIEGTHLLRWSELEGWSQLATLDKFTTSYLDENLQPKTGYRYALYFFNETGTSLPSSQAERIAETYFCVFSEDFDASSISPSVDHTGGTQIQEDSNGILWFGGAGERSISVSPHIENSSWSITFRYKLARKKVDFFDIPLPGEVPSIPSSQRPEVGSFDPHEVYGADNFYGSSLPYFSAYNSNSGFYLSSELPDADSVEEAEWRTAEITSETFRSIYPNSFPSDIKFTILQNFASGENLDTWAIDDICVLSTAPPIPQQVELLQATAVSSESIYLSWLAASSTDSYIVEREVEGVWQVLTTASTESLQSGGGFIWFYDLNLNPDSLYRYRVSAQNISGSSQPSLVAAARTLANEVDPWMDKNLASLPEGPMSEWSQHHDVDGMSVLEKYAYGLDLGVKAEFVDFEGEVTGKALLKFDHELGKLCAEFPRRVQTTEVRYLVEVSDDLALWSPLEVTAQVKPFGANWELVRFEDSVDAEVATSRYIRVRIEHKEEE